jgi:hypothetical protein
MNATTLQLVSCSIAPTIRVHPFQDTWQEQRCGPRTFTISATVSIARRAAGFG